jgi:hypothetical protein
MVLCLYLCNGFFFVFLVMCVVCVCVCVFLVCVFLVCDLVLCVLMPIKTRRRYLYVLAHDKDNNA